jgi:tetraacyldisaccharide 4'-kinase
LTDQTEVLLVTGIANPRPLKKLLEEYSHSYQYMQFPDHHIFTIDDMREIRKRFGQMDSRNKIIITTEKDAVRLDKFRDDISSLPFFVLPARHNFLFGEGEQFGQLVTDFITNFKRAS